MGLTKRTDGFYAEFRVVDDGQTLRLAGPGEGKLKRWKTGAYEKRIAKTQEAILKTQLMAGAIKSPSIERPLLFTDWVEQYLRLPEVSTLRSCGNRRAILLRIGAVWKGQSLISLRPEDVYDYRTLRLSHGLHVGTVNVEHAILKACLNVALRLRLIPYNPSALVPIPDPHNARQRVLTSDEFASIAAALEGEPMMWAAFLLGHDCGLRVGEIACLTVSHLAGDYSSLSLGAHETKTREARIVPLTTRAGAALKALGTGRLFPSKQRISKRFTALCRELQLQDLKFHDMRHCARTNLRRAGVDTETIMKWLGHKSIVTSLRYDTVSTEDLQRGLAKLNTLQANTLITSLDEDVTYPLDKSDIPVGA